MGLYISSLVFNYDHTAVALVKKKRGPDFLIGKWTAIGGCLEEGEDHYHGALRELKEEADLAPEELSKFATLVRPFGTCHMFYGRCDALLPTTKTDEEIGVFSVDHVLDNSVIFSRDLPWLVAMALAHNAGEPFYRISE